MRLIGRVGWLCLIAAIAAELVMTVAATWVYATARGDVLAADEVPQDSTLLVLGSLVDDGKPGDYVRGRLDTAIELYRSGRVARIINSGNGTAEAGDEPAVMREYLQANGIPAQVILDDPAGFDTAASCRRVGAVFGVHNPVIITQDFHLARAIALCRSVSVAATGVNAHCDCSATGLIRNLAREAVLARPRALLTAVAGR